jgi:hypothetical protein
MHCGITCDAAAGVVLVDYVLCPRSGPVFAAGVTLNCVHPIVRFHDSARFNSACKLFSISTEVLDQQQTRYEHAGH